MEPTTHLTGTAAAPGIAAPALQPQYGRLPRRTWLAAGLGLVESLGHVAASMLGIQKKPGGAAPATPFATGLREVTRSIDAQPLVSIITLNLNGCAMLEALFESFQRINRYPNFEFILIDHGSRDGSLEAAQRWAAVLPIRIVPCVENYSYSFSCNRAAQIAEGEYLLLLNNDVTFTEDIVGRMVAAAGQQRAAVGVRLLNAAMPAMTGTPIHIGVRFRWNHLNAMAGPYNVVPTPGDSAAQASPSAFPAVTGAVMACRRDEYLAIGGLWENYAYGYEDVDLCLKFRFGLGRQAVCLNDLSARHGDSRTRGRISILRRVAWNRRNTTTFSSRFGYPLRRELLRALFADDGFTWGRRPTLGVAAIANGSPAGLLAQALHQSREWPLRHLQRSLGGYNLRGIDLLLVEDPDYRLDLARHRAPALIHAAWIDGNANAWRHRDLSLFDLLLSASAAGAARLSATLGLPVLHLDAAGGQAAPAFAAMVADYIGNRHRIALKCGGQPDEHSIVQLARALRRAGHRVRIDSRPRWNLPQRILDDVVLSMPGEAPCPPQRGKINLLIGEGRDNFLADAVLPLQAPEALAAAVLQQLELLHPLRMRGPQDPPLPSTNSASPLRTQSWSAPPGACSPTSPWPL